MLLSLSVTALRRSPHCLLATLLFAASPAFAQPDASAAARTAVEVAIPETSSVAQTLPLTGTVTAERDAALSPRVSGLVQQVPVDAGARVRRGDTLLQLDSRMAQLALQRAEASLSEGRARLAESTRLRNEAKTLAERGTLPRSLYETREAEVKLAEAAIATLEATRRERPRRSPATDSPPPSTASSASA